MSCDNDERVPPDERRPEDGHGLTRQGDLVGLPVIEGDPSALLVNADAGAGPPRSGPQVDSDASLLHAHVAGDPQAFNELLRRHRAELWGVALRVLRNHHDAEDALQAALVRASQYAATFRGEASVRRWLRTITVNTALLELKQRGRLATPIDPDFYPHDATGVAATNAVETRTVLEEALRQLPEGHRAAFFLIALRGYSIIEAADLLGVQAGTVKSRVWRARQILAGLLDSSG